MGRPNKARHVCSMPRNCAFYPEGITDPIEILLSIEEYEVLRLLDYVGKSQAEAATQMGISRTSVQALYAQARKKTTRFLVEGTRLSIQGGNYELCSHPASCQLRNHFKGESIMKIAVTYENGQVFQHFGHTETFKVYEVENGKVISSEIVDTNGQGHGALANFLFNGGISILICGGIGGGARNALAKAGIELYPGASGDADAQVESFLQGSLNYDPETTCSHHSHEDGHSCGEHGCGSHSCH